MNKALHLLEQVPATIPVLLAVVSINLGSAIAIGLFGTYSVLGLRMLPGTPMLAIAYRAQLLPAKNPLRPVLSDSVIMAAVK